MSFHEIRFPDNISRGAKGGPQRRTQIVALASGDEERNASWGNSRRAYDAAYGIRRADDLAAVVAFFEARNGRLHGFRWKDWADYKSSLPSQPITGFDQPLGLADGTTSVFQLVKEYRSGAQTWVRPITKPVAGTVVINGTIPEGPELVESWDDMQDNATWFNSGTLGAPSSESYGGFTRAYLLGTTGIGLRRNLGGPPGYLGSPVVPGTVYRVKAWMKEGTTTNPVVLVRSPLYDSGIRGSYASPSAFQTDSGCAVISNVTATNLGGTNWLWSFDMVPNAGVTKLFLCIGFYGAGDRNLTIYAGSIRTPEVTGPATGWTVDPTTGIVTFASPPVAGGVLTAGFEFDVPVRFDTDDLPVTLDLERLGSITSIPLIEVRR